MSDAETYRQRAAMAERLAGEMTTGAHRDELLKIARDWRAMAEKAEAAEKATPEATLIVDFPSDPSLANPFGEDTN